MKVRHHTAIVGLSLPAILLCLRLYATPASPPLQVTDRIKLDVDLVLVSVTVTDSKNRFVQGLQKEQFRIWEDRIEQDVVQFSIEDTPVSLGIIFDKSASMGGKRGSSPIDEIRSTAYSCLQGGLREDEYFLIEFSDQSQVSADFTTDMAKLKEKILFAGAGGQTALWDAIYSGVTKLESAAHTRKALLVLTDGQENRSRYTLSDLKGLVREQDVRIYGMDRVEVQFDGFAQLAEMTGGRVFKSNNPCKELEADLKNQYVLGYHSTNKSTDGAWREIRVRVETKGLPRELSDLSIRTRSGYYANAADK